MQNKKFLKSLKLFPIKHLAKIPTHKPTAEQNEPNTRNLH